MHPTPKVSRQSNMQFGTKNYKNPVFITLCVFFLCTSCRSPMPGEDRFGEGPWDTFSRARTADAYALTPDDDGSIAGGTTFASSARRDPQVMHRIWAFLQDHKTFDQNPMPGRPPIPEYLVRYGRDGE